VEHAAGVGPPEQPLVKHFGEDIGRPHPEGELGGKDPGDAGPVKLVGQAAAGGEDGEYISGIAGGKGEDRGSATGRGGGSITGRGLPPKTKRLPYYMEY